MQKCPPKDSCVKRIPDLPPAYSLEGGESVVIFQNGVTKALNIENLPGSSGGTGPAGPAGAVGATGPQGVTGVAGVAGAVGATGPQGVAGAAGPSIFSAITSATNTQAAMVVGTGASLAVSGSGTIVATSLTLTAEAALPVSTAQAAANTAIYTASQAYADGLVVGLLDDRGNHDASANTFPSTGGSGAAGAVLKGDLWRISVAGTLGGQAVTAGDQIRVLVNTPGQTAGNWAIVEGNFGFVPENAANKDVSSGYAGLTGFTLRLKNAAGAVTSFLASAATAARTWTFPDKDGTVAMLSDIVVTGLTGPITSTGNATTVAAQTGTGSTFVMQASPTLTTPALGVASATSLAITGTAGAGFQGFVAQSVAPTAPAAATTNLFSSTTNGFTRLIQQNEAATSLILGRDSVILVRNTSGATLSKGSVVYVTGSTGSVPNVSSAQANSSTTLPALGILVDDIVNNAYGQSMLIGVISSVNTSAFTAGASLFVSTTVLGGLTSTRPTGTTNFVQRVGTVLVSGVGTGSIKVFISPSLLNAETGTNAAVWTGNSVVASSVTLSGNISSPAWTTAGLRFRGNPATLTDTTSTGTVPIAYTDSFGGNTIAAAAATTYTNYITAYFKDPIAGPNVTLPNKWALGADSFRAGSTGQFAVSAAGVVTLPASQIVNGVTLTNAGLSTNFLTAAGTYAAASGGSGLPTDGTGAMTGAIATTVGTLTSTVANGAAATAFTLNTASLTTAGADILKLQNNSVTKNRVDKDGNVWIGGVGGVSQLNVGTYNAEIGLGGNNTAYVNGNNNTFVLKSTGRIAWSTNTTNDGNSAYDTGYGRNAPGVAEFNNGTAGAFRDWKARNGILTGNLALGIVAKTASYTVTANDGVIECDATTAAITLTLPAVATAIAGTTYTLKKTDASANAVIWDGNASETIDGATTMQTTTQWASITIIRNTAGTAWLTLKD